MLRILATGSVLLCRQTVEVAPPKKGPLAALRTHQSETPSVEIVLSADLPVLEDGSFLQPQEPHLLPPSTGLRAGNTSRTRGDGDARPTPGGVYVCIATTARTSYR